MKPSAPHRQAEREAIKRARYFIKHREYRRAIEALAVAIEQEAAGDVKDAWWKHLASPPHEENSVSITKRQAKRA